VKIKSQVNISYIEICKR